MAELLWISDNEQLYTLLHPVLKKIGFSVTCHTHLGDVQSSDDAIDLVVFAPSQFGQQDYLNFIDHPLSNSADWILISDGNPNRWCDKMMNHGVAYHFRQPLELEHIGEVFQEFANEYCTDNRPPKEQALSSHLDQFGLLLGSSAPMRRLYRLIRRVAPTDSNVLLIGESGSGKELAAQTIHQQSLRADKPFIAVNCAAFSSELIESELFGHEKGAFTGAIANRDGLFAQCQSGTLFLDEITEMPLALQSKLLRVLETGEYQKLGSEQPQSVNVRIVAATNRDPLSAIEENYLREDLYFRLAHFPIQLPALNQRGDDILALAKHFLAYRNQQTGACITLTPEAEQQLSQYSWPGNVRELKHCIERAHILANNQITLNELPTITQPSQIHPTSIGPGTSIKEAEKTLIIDTLKACENNKTRAAELLGISVKTLYNKLHSYAIKDDEI
ncbi:sigma-54 interaction domain-containing protein [Celerinatantimonas diazotrophica]|uniref:Fis family sigma54 specific transcriptional regulator n=1 Tax=Celerinatantimonas diazotrophica TaxID=412034 RepID=A0A4R1J986_9GAMM|nr:sigma-54 dependent transcriptional regulator [Celerinatantimonas diazotrophica]TCK46967.1 Fis family sigma54 specific transcriptional regulator [Celerinatantimonas diazotrophica]CAG9295735.1 Anaerobic nitric oxide reductase transcription regulator NorR [Celerinatantimonas diazotrophica]